MKYNSKVPTHCLVLSHLIAPHCGTFNFICKSCRKCRSDEGLLSSFAALTDDTWETCLANQIGLYRAEGTSFHLIFVLDYLLYWLVTSLNLRRKK